MPLVSIRTIIAALVVITTSCVCPSAARGATYNWTGATGNNLWSGIAGGVTNWSPNALPPSTESIAFSGPAPTTTISLQTNRTINDVTFGGTAGYRLRDGSLHVSSGAIAVQAAAAATIHEIDAPLSVGAAGVFNVGSQSTLRIMRGLADGTSQFGVAKTGAGKLVIAKEPVNLHSLTAIAGTLDIDGASVTSRLGGGFGFDFQTNTNVTNGSQLFSQPGAFVRVMGISQPLLTLDGANTRAVGSTYFSVGISGFVGAVAVRNDAEVSTAVFMIARDNQGAGLSSSALIERGGKVTAGVVTIANDPGSAGVVTVENDGLITADTFRFGGFDTATYGGAATVNIQENGQANVSGETTFYTSLSTLNVDRGVYTTKRLATTNGSTPVIRLRNRNASTMALVINNDSLQTTSNFAGVIADVAGGSGGIRKTGAGNQILSGQSTYTGGTRIEAGRLTVGTINALPTSGAITMTGGVLDLAGRFQQTGAVTLQGGIVSGGSPSLLAPSSVALESGTIAVPTFASGGVTKTTAGTAMVAAPLSASSVTVSAGMLVLAQGVTAPTVQVDGGTLQIAGVLTGKLASAVPGAVTLGGAVAIKGSTTLAGSLAIGGHTLVNEWSQSITAGSLTVAGGTLVSAGGVTLSGAASGHGTISGRIIGPNSASFTAAGGTLTLGDAAVSNSLASYSGALAAGSHQLNLLSSGVTSLGEATTIAGGKLASLNGLRLPAGRTLSGSGTVQSAFVNQGGVTGGAGEQTLTFTGAVSGAGSFAGNVAFEGSYSPGNSAASTSFENLALRSAARLTLEIGGTVRGTEHDVVDASGTLALDGTLAVSLINGFVPAAGQTFDLLDWSTLAGSFSSIQLPALDGLFWDASKLYESGSLTVSAPLAADFNLDGSVDGDDLARWKTNFGLGSATRAQGDANSDGIVDGGDFLVWQREYGRELVAGSTGISAVPEPASWALALAAAMGLVASRRQDA